MVRETYKLINTIKKMYPVIEFLHNRYFPDGKVYYSEKALIETKKKGRKAAPFVVPVVGGIIMENEGYRADEFEAPYIAPKKLITAQDLEKKAFGESPESGRTPEQRENEVQAEHMDDLRASILRRLELMCSEIIISGKVLMKHYATAEDAAKGVNYSLKYLQFYDKEFGNYYVWGKDTGKKFGSMNASEKIEELYRMASELRKRGVRATDMVMTSDVSLKFMADNEFLEFYNKRRVEIGDIDPKELPDGVVCNGRININGTVMTMFTYEEEYEDLDGTVKPIFPKGTIAFLHPNLGETVYAQVTFVQGSSFKSYAEKIIPRLVADEKLNTVEVQEFSRPVPYPHDWESWLITNIYDEPAAGADDGGITTFGMEPQENEAETFSGEQQEGTEIKTEAEINAMNRKTDVIAYGESLGMPGLTEDMRLDELKQAVLNYQEEEFGE
ncbi:hypothetical protein D7V82_14670 [bacterium 1xD8-6]|nr:hypothetical protein D7V72_15960 [bacterium D16-36]RKI66557.1 hypothetical protein D7V82_14670 [bacterium 1xD8-6]